MQVKFLETALKNWDLLVAGIGVLLAVGKAGKTATQQVIAIYTAFLPLFDAEESLALRLARQQFIIEALLEWMPGCVYLTDKKGECVRGNQALATLFGIERHALLGNGWLEAVHNDDREKTWEVWQRALTKKIPYAATYRLKNGQLVSTQATFLYLDGVMQYSIGKDWPVEQNK